MTPAVLASMTPAYDYCNEESGAGCFDRMKRHMSSHVELTKKSMFDETSQKIFDQLVILQVRWMDIFISKL